MIMKVYENCSFDTIKHCREAINLLSVVGVVDNTAISKYITVHFSTKAYIHIYEVNFEDFLKDVENAYKSLQGSLPLIQSGPSSAKNLDLS